MYFDRIVQVFIALIWKLIFSFNRFLYARMGRKGVNSALELKKNVMKAKLTFQILFSWEIIKRDDVVELPMAHSIILCPE